jgi:hypothetical protein
MPSAYEQLVTRCECPIEQWVELEMKELQQRAQTFKIKPRTGNPRVDQDDEEGEDDEESASADESSDSSDEGID